MEGGARGAEGGVMEAGLLPVPKKPPKGIKTDVTKLRLGGGQVWQDHSLEDWDPSECRERGGGGGGGGGGGVYTTDVCRVGIM